MSEPVHIREVLPGVLDAILTSCHARKPLAVRADWLFELTVAVTLESVLKAVRRRSEREARRILLAAIYPERFA